MKISRNWLQTYFDAELPSVDKLLEELTFHAFEVEGYGKSDAGGEWDVLDVKVTPNRGHDALCHRSIAKELSAILKIPMKNDPLREPVSLEPRTDKMKVTVENPELCPRFTAAYITGVKVGPTADGRILNFLESVGQRSINNVVDATNYVMFNLGQPLHAFDAGKLTEKGGMKTLTVRAAKKGEKMLGLDDKEYTLEPWMLAIANSDGEAVSIAGIKGGKPTGIDEKTTDIILEAANWNGITIRKTSQALKLRTDASDRFQQVISPELAPYGLKATVDLIVQLAGGEVAGFIDEYPKPQEKWTVSVTLKKINDTLGTKFTAADVADVFKRLDFSFEHDGQNFTVTPPFERLDLVIPEDLVEEVARIVGYDKISGVELPLFPKKPEINENFYASEKVRTELTAKGYSEVFTSVFADDGERVIANKVDGVRPYLRANLVDGLKDALEKNARNKDLLGLKEVQLFEIGTVWRGGKEEIMLGTADKAGVKEMPLEAKEASVYEDLPLSNTDRYQPFSRYPSITRDIALWTSAGTEPDAVLAVIRAQAGELLVRSELFDRFEKGDKLSLAFRLVFQSFEKTLTDAEANAVMEKVYAAVKGSGLEVR